MSEKYFAQPSVMSTQQHFSQVPSAEIERSKFDRSHAVKTTFDAGKLIPIFVDEILPGDTFTLSTTTFARLATPLKPIMDNLYMDIHYWFIPNRLVWDDWQAFMGERKNPDDDPNAIELPRMPWLPGTTPSAGETTVGEYFGLPPISSSTEYQSVSVLPFRALKLTFNEWYRDQNLQDSIEIAFGDYDPVLDVDFTPLRRNKRHDYFTSCLPWPQKGDPVVIPLGGEIPVFGMGHLDPNSPFVGQVGVTNDPNLVKLYGQSGAEGAVSYVADAEWFNDTLTADQFLRLRDDEQVATGDLSTATAVTINELRTAFQIQRLLERDARGGTRYIELILSHFGVRSDDARLQRPEYLGGGTTRININPIASTATVPDEAPQANLAAVGTGVVRGGFQKSFTEHGFVIGLASVRADLTYQRGIERFWSRETRYDFYWPALAHLGEQAVLNKEIWYSAQASLPPGERDFDVFGYQERYAEYRYKPSLITGRFNSNVSAPLDVWHLSQDFANLPRLNEEFIQEDPPIDRVIAVPTEPHFIADIWHDLKCDRPMPVYSVPGLIDHF